MKPGDLKFLDYWARARKDGRWMYALKHGVVFFAWPVYCGTEFIKFLFRRSDYHFSGDRILVGILVWSVLGFLAFAFLLWPMQEKRYTELQKKEPE